ncbi:MAG: hypothetical protein NUW23_15480 [Firmicutes bacterium]|nr:hypothetical protein [Bacillota bacterium]
MKHWARTTTVVILACLSALILSSVAIGSSIVIRFKDGTSVVYDLSKIESLTFSETAETQASLSSVPGKLVWSDEFEQGVSQVWEPIEVVGGKYNAFARVQSGSFVVSVPAGNYWGKTGLMTRNPLLTVDGAMENSPASVVFKFDPAGTTGFCLALSAYKDPDVWRVPNLWVAWVSHPTSGEARFAVVNTQGSEKAGSDGVQKTQALAPDTIRLQIRPGVVDVIPTGTGEPMTCQLGWLRTGTNIYVYVFSHPWDANLPASYTQQSVQVYR